MEMQSSNSGRVSGFADHMKEYGKDIGRRYITQPINNKDPISMTTGAIMAAMSIVLEGPDQLYDGMLGRGYEAPKGIAGRITRDTKLLAKDLLTLHPLRAAGDAWRLVTDPILDAGDLVHGPQYANAA